MFNRLGIGARLLLAFLGISALSLSSGIAGWIILRDISQAQLRVNAEALPVVAAAQRTADASARLAAASPSLSSVNSEAERAGLELELAGLEGEIRRAVADAAFSSFDRDSVGELSKTVNLLVSNLSRQSGLVKGRLELEKLFGRRADGAISAAASIVDLSETLVSNASAGAAAVISNLYELIDDPSRRSQSYDALDRLIEEDIYLLDRMSELRLRSSQIGLLANRLTRAADVAEVQDIARAFNDHLRVIRRRVASIDDPIRQAQAQSFLQVLQAASGQGPWGRSLFSQRLRLIEIGGELGRLTDGNRGLSQKVSGIAQDMFAKSANFARTTASQAESAVNAGFYLLVGTSLVAVLSSILIVWLFVERSIVRRLAHLAGAMERLTAGDLAVEVAEEGTPELKAMSKAVRTLRDETTQRRALEVERERTNEELRRHREDLQELVDERTRQLRDTNARLHVEVAQHAEARETAESASRAKSDFLAAMSHEIRTPMTGVLGMVRVLNNSALSAAQRRQLAVASSSGEALLGILNSILDYSKIESGKTSIDTVSFSLRETLAGVTELMRPAAQEKGLAISFTCGSRIWARHGADEGKLRQIVFNLVSNAIKFTAHGRIAIAAAWRGDVAGCQNVAIAVTDTGIGITAGDQDRIFESFTQSDASITRRYGGTGLGLAISRRLAGLLGGKLSVRSQAGAGSSFVLELPLGRAAAPQRRPPSTAAVARQESKGRNILIVEDDKATQIVARAFVEAMGHRVSVAADGLQAISLVAGSRPDLVLMDISLPEIDGAETARRLRTLRNCADLPVVAMSAHVFKGDIEQQRAAGMNGFVSKPLEPLGLRLTIDAALRGQAVSGIDHGALERDIAQLGPATVKRILDVAADTVPARFAAMTRALSQKHFDRLAELAHATRSSAAAAGFTSLLDAAALLEEAARANHAGRSRRLLATCKRSYQAAMAEARRLLEAPQARAAAKR